MKRLFLHTCLVAALTLVGACNDDPTSGDEEAQTRIDISFTCEGSSGDGLWTQQEIHFTNTSQITGSSAAAFEWDFGFQGVGSTSTEENPTVVFTSAGEKTVTLTVTAADGTKVSGSQKITLQRTNGLPEASFTHDPEAPSIGDEVTFTDTSVDSDGEIVSWAWDFGDGNRSELQSPIHTYTASGSYTVTLTVTDNDGGEDTATLNLAVSEAPEAELAWSTLIAEAGQINHGAAALGSSHLYAATTAGELVAVNLTTHQIDWRFDLTKDGAALGDPMNTPSVDSDGTVYYAVGKSSAAFVYAIDGTTGSQKWRYTIGSSGVRVEYNYPLISDQDYIVIGNRGTNGSIIVLSKSDGSERFRGAPAGGVGGCLALAQDGTILSCSTGTNAFTLSSFLNGSWTICNSPLNLWYGNYANGVQPAIDRSGRVYLAIQNQQTGGGSVGCFDLSKFDGSTQLQPEWQVDCDAQIKYSGCVLGPDNRVYVVSQQDSGIGEKAGELLAIRNDGTLLWSWPTESKILCVPAVDNAGNIHLADQGAGNYIIISPEGEILFKEQCCAKSHTSPVIGDDGMVYLLGEQTKGGACYVYAYKLKSATGPADTDWPQYGQNARHTGLQLP